MYVKPRKAEGPDGLGLEYWLAERLLQSGQTPYARAYTALPGGGRCVLRRKRHTAHYTSELQQADQRFFELSAAVFFLSVVLLFSMPKGGPASITGKGARLLLINFLVNGFTSTLGKRETWREAL